MGVDLLKHNQEAYEKVQKAISEGKKKIAVSHATGTGKSYLITKLFEDFNNDKKLVLVPSTYISDQIQTLFKKYDIQNVDIMLYQKLIKMSDEDIAAMDYDVIALDEYHHDTSKVWGNKVRTLIDTHSESIIFGTSATPVRSDGVNTIDELFEGNCASDLPLSESIAKKIVPLPKYVGALYTLDDELEKLRQKVENATNTSEEKQEFYKKINTMRSQIEKSYGIPIILNKHIKNKEGKYIIFCKKKNHLREIKETVIGWFRTAGCKNINAYEVYSDYENKDAEYKAFCEDTSHNLKLLFCVNMLNEGLHLENISGVLLLRPTRSSIVWHQQIGRAIEANNTNTPVIIDAVNNFSAVGQGMELLKEIKNAVAKEKESDSDFDDSEFEDIDTFFVLEQVVEIQEMFREIEWRLKGREWTEEEDSILKEYYPVEGSEVIDRLSGRTKKAIIERARMLEVSKKHNQIWTEEENEILKKYYLVEGIKVIARLSGRTKRAIMVQARRLGIGTKKNSNYTKWTNKEIGILRQYYPIEGLKVKNRLDGRTKSSIITKAYKLDIKAPDNSWTDEEIEILKEYYPVEGISVERKLNNKTRVSIQAMANSLKIKQIGRIWTEKEVEILKKYYPIEGTNVKERLNNKGENSIVRKAKNLGVRYEKSIFSKREDEIIRQYYPIEGNDICKRLNGKTIEQCKSRAAYLKVYSLKNKWTDEEYAILKKYYPEMGSKVSAMLNKSDTACMAMAHKLGIEFIKRNRYRYVHKHGNKYVVQMYIDGKKIRFGTFDSEDEAAKVAMQKAREYGKAI